MLVYSELRKSNVKVFPKIRFVLYCCLMFVPEIKKTTSLYKAKHYETD